MKRLLLLLMLSATCRADIILPGGGIPMGCGFGGSPFYVMPNGQSGVVCQTFYGNYLFNLNTTTRVDIACVPNTSGIGPICIHPVGNLQTVSVIPQANGNYDVWGGLFTGETRHTIISPSGGNLLLETFGADNPSAFPFYGAWKIGSDWYLSGHDWTATATNYCDKGHCQDDIWIQKNGVWHYYTYNCGDSSYLNCRIKMEIMLGPDGLLWVLVTRDSDHYVSKLKLNPSSMAVVGYDPDFIEVNGEWPTVRAAANRVASAFNQMEPWGCQMWDMAPMVWTIGSSGLTSSNQFRVNTANLYPIFISADYLATVICSNGVYGTICVWQPTGEAITNWPCFGTYDGANSALRGLCGNLVAWVNTSTQGIVTVLAGATGAGQLPPPSNAVCTVTLTNTVTQTVTLTNIVSVPKPPCLCTNRTIVPILNGSRRVIAYQTNYTVSVCP